MTNREILLLKKSGVLDLVDTIIIQYCNNDYQENVNFYNLKNEIFNWCYPPRYCSEFNYNICYEFGTVD